MDRGATRRAASWLARREQPDQAMHERYPWLPFGALPAGSASRVPSASLSAMEARLARRRRVMEQPRDWRGRWVREV